MVKIGQKLVHVVCERPLMKKLYNVAYEKLINTKGRHGILDIFMDVSHNLEMAICVVNQLKNDSYC